MNFKKIALILFVALMKVNAQPGKVLCPLPKTQSEFVGFGVLMSGTLSGLLTVRQGLRDLLIRTPDESDAVYLTRSRKSLKKYLIRSVVSVSMMVTGFSLLNCSMYGIGINK